MYDVSATANAAVNTGTNTETTVLSTPMPDVVEPVDHGVLVSGSLNITAGTGTTAVVVKVRQGVGTGGTQVASMTVTLAAGNSASIPFSVLDLAPGANPGRYTVTVTQTGGTAAGTVNQATVRAEQVTA